MIKRSKTLYEAQNEVNNLFLKPIKIALNRGRNKIERYKGTIISVHSNLFVIKIDNNPLVSSLCCSYKELICGDVKIAMA